MKKIGTSPPDGINIENLNVRENYLLSAAVAACVWLSGEKKDRHERKHLNRRKVAERLQRALKKYQLDDSQVDFYCMLRLQASRTGPEESETAAWPRWIMVSDVWAKVGNREVR